MATLLWITGFALLIMETFTGMVANGFIVLINCTDWFKSRKLSPTDLILTCLGLSRLIWQATVMLHVTMLSFFLHIYILNHGHLILSIVWFFTENFNLWFAAWLSVLYFVKIATFSHSIFLQVKLRFSGLVPWLLFSSVVLSAFIAIVMTGSNSGLAFCDLYKLYSTNSCDSEIGKCHSCRHFFIATAATNFLPMAIFLSSTILLIISLWKHIRHLQNNGTGVRDLNTNVHLSAIKALASFAILYLASFVATTLQSMLAWGSNDRSWTSVFLYNVSTVYSSVHAVILILINPKLKQAWIRMIQYIKCPLRETLS